MKKIIILFIFCRFFQTIAMEKMLDQNLAFEKPSFVAKLKHDQIIERVVWSPDGNRIIIVTNKTFEFWNSKGVHLATRSRIPSRLDRRMYNASTRDWYNLEDKDIDIVNQCWVSWNKDGTRVLTGGAHCRYGGEQNFSATSDLWDAQGEHLALLYDKGIWSPEGTHIGGTTYVKYGRTRKTI